MSNLPTLPLTLFPDPYQVSANLLLETEDVRQSINQLNREVVIQEGLDWLDTPRHAKVYLVMT